MDADQHLPVHAERAVHLSYRDARYFLEHHFPVRHEGRFGGVHSFVLRQILRPVLSAVTVSS